LVCYYEDKFRQLGQYEDVETGLYYNRFRYYDPETGLYISQAPIGLAGNYPNFYAYTFDSNSEVAPFGLDIIEETWKVITQNINNSKTTTVLGHFPNKNKGEIFESYIEKAIRKKANYFNIGDMWNEVSKVTDPWVLNERFLDVITERGDKILLNVPKNKIRPHSYLEKEIKYLEEYGYKWINQWVLVKKCK
jgi:RHS repeat-associated protein